ncbi:deoxyhypusine synthase [Ignicoccus hospitalis]|uniref:Probable deoxyhypusine synthase n=1 Tax=Ignicoccus hospitalis (strain KIN4/I / DSM 18386 / JCM 14125) TaxID=453591 RepID=DHYS_IGNH4|nr:deoxyhypusine synthase [Ignicoccus hospitalis]A8AA61.1 RecName: Full=Probable deoxyhypusine synthase; Short=DHS [Ignicoccus hospitalis KIN4/I]ABU81813.1 Deoxyhypusine synthase [Ignicoccus hospitalis KIN4/I]HIH90082.1 deoxyhypusine synthase [Desulfurococcaceae archaeon]
MNREDFIKEPVEDIRVSERDTVADLIEKYCKVHGFTAADVCRAVEVLSEGLRNSDLRFLSFTANLVATGLRGLLAQMVRSGYFDVVVTTCGTLDHDVARSLGHKYYKGYFEADDVVLAKSDIHRLGNVFIPVENYGPPVERLVKDVLRELGKTMVAPYELIWEVGKRLSDENSILRAAWERKVPVIVPGITDGAFGTAIFTYSEELKLQGKDFCLDVLADEKLLSDMVFSSKRSAALVVGGGISKHHVIWWNQFKGGLDYAVYLTTAQEYDGSLSGARPREAITWGKLKPEGRSATVYGDATVLLPIIWAGVLAKVQKA